MLLWARGIYLSRICWRTTKSSFDISDGIHGCVGRSVWCMYGIPSGRLPFSTGRMGAEGPPTMAARNGRSRFLDNLDNRVFSRNTALAQVRYVSARSVRTATQSFGPNNLDVTAARWAHSAQCASFHALAHTPFTGRGNNPSHGKPHGVSKQSTLRDDMCLVT